VGPGFADGLAMLLSIPLLSVIAKPFTLIFVQIELAYWS
jgi:hypothetical protein